MIRDLAGRNLSNENIDEMFVKIDEEYGAAYGVCVIIDVISGVLTSFKRNGRKMYHLRV